MNIEHETPKTGPCDCEQCRALCLRRPGWFAPGQATRAAAELGLSLKAFFEQYLCVDFWCDSEHGDVELLSPAWDTSKERARLFLGGRPSPGPMNGRRATWAEGLMSGPCALLGPNGCRLSFENRPEECRKVYGCDYPECDVRDPIVEAWRTERAELVQLGFGGGR